ncbi:MAG: hypothetical protein Q4B26_10110 [Eubacteriales bacterium]|nr:hypothetical protein [Eubacteriales bacterium]
MMSENRAPMERIVKEDAAKSAAKTKKVLRNRSDLNPLKLAKAMAEVILIGLIMHVDVTCGLMAIVGAVIPLLSADK